jgi:hypothetical protein
MLVNFMISRVMEQTAASLQAILDDQQKIISIAEKAKVSVSMVIEEYALAIEVKRRQEELQKLESNPETKPRELREKTKEIGIVLGDLILWQKQNNL